MKVLNTSTPYTKKSFQYLKIYLRTKLTQEQGIIILAIFRPTLPIGPSTLLFLTSNIECSLLSHPHINVKNLKSIMSETI